MCAGEDEHGLIGIRQQHLLILTLRPRVEPDDGPLPSFDIFDHPASIWQHRNVDAVTNSGDIACGASLLELAAQLTNSKALPGLYCKETGLGFDNQTL